MISDRIKTRRLLFGIPLDTADLYSSGTALGNSLAVLVQALKAQGESPSRPSTQGNSFLHNLRPLRSHAIPFEFRSVPDRRRRHLSAPAGSPQHGGPTPTP